MVLPFILKWRDEVLPFILQWRDEVLPFILKWRDEVLPFILKWRDEVRQSMHVHDTNTGGVEEGKYECKGVEGWKEGGRRGGGKEGERRRGEVREKWKDRRGKGEMEGEERKKRRCGWECTCSGKKFSPACRVEFRKQLFSPAGFGRPLLV